MCIPRGCANPLPEPLPDATMTAPPRPYWHASTTNLVPTTTSTKTVFFGAEVSMWHLDAPEAHPHGFSTPPEKPPATKGKTHVCCQSCPPRCHPTTFICLTLHEAVRSSYSVRLSALSLAIAQDKAFGLAASAGNCSLAMRKQERHARDCNTLLLGQAWCLLPTLNFPDDTR